MRAIDAAIREKTAVRGRPFPKGKSGNPSGRPKRTAEQQDALEALRGLSGKAVAVVEGLLADKTASPSLRLKAAEIVFERCYGKPPVAIEVGTQPPIEIAWEIKTALAERERERLEESHEKTAGSFAGLQIPSDAR